MTLCIREEPMKKTSIGCFWSRTHFVAHQAQLWVPIVNRLSPVDCANHNKAKFRTKNKLTDAKAVLLRSENILAIAVYQG